MKRNIVILCIVMFAVFLPNTVSTQNVGFYLTGGYTFTRAPLNTFHEFTALYNENPNKIHGYVFTHGFADMKCLNGIYYGAGMNYKGSLLVEINYSRKFNHTFAYYDPANNPDYLRVDLGFGIGTVELAFLKPMYFGALTVSPGIGMGFLSRKLYYWDDDSLMIAPRRKDMIVEVKKGSFSLDPMLQVSYKPFSKIPVEIVARTYYQAMFSRMSVGWLGEFEGYWSPADTASKKLTGGNLGITFAIKVNIPSFKIKPKPRKPKDEPVIIDNIVYVIDGKVVDAASGNPVNAVVTLYEGQTPAASVVSQQGKFTIKPEPDITYTVEIKAFGYQTKTETIRLDKNSPNPYPYTVSLNKLAVGQTVVLENILFEKASAVLLPESYPELNKLLIFMKNEPDVRIEIAGHTSSDGNDAYNLQLSQDRANAVAEYIIDRGVKESRIVAKGYGETKPVATNDTEEGRKLNRRVEFKIIE